ncbi:hypothetical protein DLM_3574 [Aquitalea magnusonii]|uniref:Uncharacterized protein n=1 Tax=Aquitalea magnusonii TaxID=332411 RepID=A0A3G9GH19_9NEIS|nr:hypothetical protein DLM_3574 [Aquitalea magnusonii]
MPFLKAASSRCSCKDCKRMIIFRILHRNHSLSQHAHTGLSGKKRLFTESSRTTTRQNERQQRHQPRPPCYLAGRAKRRR